jgi:hypothetical protein
MKRILTALLATALGAALVLSAACGDDDDDEAEAASDSTETEGEVDPEADFTEAPPLVYLEAGDERLEGELGNYQWEGVVADAFAIITPTETSELTAGPVTFVTSDTPFQSGAVTVFAAGDGQIEPETVPDGNTLRWAAFPEEGAPQPLTIEVGPDGAVDLSDLEPGTYLISFFGTWEQGYGEYGFYVEVV